MCPGAHKHANADRSQRLILTDRVNNFNCSANAVHARGVFAVAGDSGGNPYYKIVTGCCAQSTGYLVTPLVYPAVRN